MAKSNYIVRGGADFSKITKGFNTMQKQLGGFQTRVNKTMKAIGISLSGLAIGSLVKSSTKAAMSVESALDNISRNMGASSKAFNSWVENQSKALGMAKSEAYQYGSVFSNLLSSFASSSAETATQTQDLMKAAAVIASKTGRTYDDVANRIRSGMLGSTEAIEDLGVYTQVSMIETTNAFKKFANGKSWAQLDFRVQQQIRLAAILEQTYDRYGDTLADTTQTRQAMFIASLKNIQLSLGQAFLPIYNAVLPLLTALSNKLLAAISILQQFTTALFGKAVAGTQTEEQADAFSNMGDAAEAAGGQTKKAAKDIKGALAGFDEINTLSQKADTSGGGGAFSGGVGGIGLTDTAPEIGAGAELSPAIQTAIAKFHELIAPLKAISLDNLKVAFDNVRIALEPITQTLFEGLEWAYTNLFVPLATWVIEDLLPAWLNNLAAAMGAVSEVLDALKPLGKWLWEKFLQPIAKWTGGKIVEVLESLSEGLTKVSDWVKDNQEAVRTMAIVIGSFALAWNLVNVAVALWNIIGVIATAVTTGFGAAVAFLTSPIGLVIIAIAAIIAIVVLLVKHWDKVKEVALKVWDAISAAWSVVAGWFDTKVLTPLKNGFKNAINFLVTLAEGYVNVWIKAINFIVGALNKIQFNVPDWVPGIGGKKLGFNIKQLSEVRLPRLAKGGITNGPMTAIIGDNPGGREVVSPLDDLLSMIKEAVSSANGGADPVIESNIYFGDDVFYKAVQRAKQGADRRYHATVTV